MKGIERFHWTTFEWLYMAPENPYDGPYNHETHSLYEKFRDHHNEQEEIVDKKVFAKAKEIASRTKGLIFTNSMGGPAWGHLMSFVSENAKDADDAINELYRYVKRFKHALIVES